MEGKCFEGPGAGRVDLARQREDGPRALLGFGDFHDAGWREIAAGVAAMMETSASAISR